MNGIPNGSKKRFRNNTEFIFHFVKNQKELKFYMDRALREPAESNKERRKYNWTIKTHGDIIDGERTNKKTINYLTGSTNKTKEGYELPNTKRTLPDLVRPDNVFRFPTAGLARDNTIRHPAPYHKDLPIYFINLLTDEGDVVLDVFSGIGTTGLGCNDRQYIGFELNEKYAEFSKKRLLGEELEEWLVCQYDLNDNLIACYKNRMEASKATGIDDGDIMRTYNRTKFDSRGGYKWKLEKKERIHQYDMNDNFIESFDSPSEACKVIGCNSFHHIITCYRGHSQSYMGYKWKLEKE
jgi:hypothetical protein